MATTKSLMVYMITVSFGV